MHSTDGTKSQRDKGFDLDMAAQARECIEALDARQQDITMLWSLKNPAWLRNFKAGRELLDWSANIVGVPESVSKGEDFQLEVKDEFRRRGIRAVAPERVVDFPRKDPVKEMCMDAKWPKPFFPVMLQTRPGPTQPGCGAFIMFSSWQDAMIALRIMAGTKRYKGKHTLYPAEMVFENQVTDMHGYDFPCRIILDCDAKPSEFGGRYTLEQLGEAIDSVAEWFAKRLVEIGAIKDTDRLIVFEKEKSRKDKASRHLIFNITARSTWETQHILRVIFGEEKLKAEAAERLAASGKKSKAREPEIPEPWRVVDAVPHHGRGQYSVLGFFDRKKGESENPNISKRMVIVNGKTVPDKRTAGLISRTDCIPENPLFLELLRRACYSCPTDEFVTIHPKFMLQKQVFSTVY